MSNPDIIDELAGIVVGSRLDLIRYDRVEARDHAQKSYVALFDPDDQSEVSVRDRFAIASFVVGLHGDDRVTKHYLDKFDAEKPSKALASAIAHEVRQGKASGPYGAYPAGPLTRENVTGPSYRVAEASREVLGTKLAAGLEHAHLLVLHPRDASPVALQALLDAGWSVTGIVTLSQIIAFLAFQIRVVAGLRVLDRKFAADRLDAAE
ncbi:CMD domain protein [Aminobacter sp. UC22_36]|uniref:CMD domain protein n=1 Tax=Aminobacter sp. UC22_36 TaxID=3374549 RepID=UPI003756A481